MRKIIYSVALLAFFSTTVNAQTDSVSKKTVQVITMHTMSYNYIKGILAGASDSSISIFPGTVKQLKKGEDFRIATFGYESIRNIKLKKRKAVLKGVLIGGGIGLLPAIASSVTGATGTKGSYAVLSVITVPVGMISGGVIGMSSGRKYNITGDREKFQQFLSEIK